MAMIYKVAVFLLLLVCSLSGKAQSDLSAITQRYDEYNAQFRATKIQLIFNQDKYIPGDTAYFKAYFMYENHALVTGKQLINIHLTDDSGKSWVDFKMNVSNGIGYNQIVIPKSITPGFYLVSASNEWMKNFEKDLVFKKELQIVNKNQIIAGDTSKQTLAKSEHQAITITTHLTAQEVQLSFKPNLTFGDTHQELLLLITSKGKVVHSENFNTSSKSDFKFNQKDLGSGIAQVSVLDARQQLLASSSIYIPSSQKVNVKIDPSKGSFSTREQVQVNFALSDNNGQAIEGEFSVKVLNQALFTEGQNSLLDQIESGERLAAEAYQEPWDKILAADQKRPAYDLSNIIQKTGRAVFSDTHLPIPNQSAIIFYLQRDQIFYQVFTSPEGLFNLNLLDVYGEDELFFTAENKEGEIIENFKIEWSSTAETALPKASESIQTEDMDPLGDFNRKTDVIEKSYGIFTTSLDTTTNQDATALTTFEKSYMLADDILLFEEYKLFPTMMESIKEIINPLRTITIGKKKEVKIKSLNKTVATGEPLYIIDGIATKNTEFFLSLKTSDLVSIKIFRNSKKLARLGFTGKNGIVMVQTKSGNTREAVKKENLITGLQMPVRFNTPNYGNSVKSLKPDFRSTIFWAPSISTDSNGNAKVEFYTSDDVGTLRIRIDGFSKNGAPFTAFKTIEVVNGSN
jgi:hypothetical protein